MLESKLEKLILIILLRHVVVADIGKKVKELVRQNLYVRIHNVKTMVRKLMQILMLLEILLKVKNLQNNRKHSMTMLVMVDFAAKK